MASRAIIIVDDEPDALFAVETMLESSGCEHIVTCENVAGMWSEIERRGAELVILDLIMPGVSGEETLSRLQHEWPDVPVIMATGMDELETAVRCMRKGAHDYLVKPLERERLVTAVRHALEIRDLERNCAALSMSLLTNDLQNPAVFSAIKTANPKMKAIFKYIEAVGISSHPILITGETGVGKELVAQAIHKASGRGGDFVGVNTAGLDDTIFADTLFGHAKGAFTGADSARRGFVDKAAGGTLFLDEIGDLSIASQVKLLRLLQEHEYHPLGSDVAKHADTRIVAATSRSIADLQNSDVFRRDLFYRLKTHHIHIPPLRERKDDIRPLTLAFLQAAATEFGKPPPTPPEELFRLLETWHFPGNVRELHAMVFDAVAVHKGKMLSLRNFKSALGLSIENEYLDTPPDRRNLPVTFHDRLPTLKECEALLLAEALDRAGGNKSIAGSLLGITRQAIAQRLKNNAG
jgi:DNA-binding NtrC family response regulator